MGLGIPNSSAAHVKNAESVIQKLWTVLGESGNEKHCNPMGYGVLRVAGLGFEPRTSGL